MKKYITIAALLAAGSTLANAETLTLDSANAVITAPSNGYTTDDGTFSVVLSLDVATLRTYLEKDQPLAKYTLVGYNCAGTATGVVTNYISENNKISDSGLYYLWGTNYAWNEPTNADSTLTDGGNNLATLDWNTITGAGLTYTFSKSSGTTVAFNLIDENGDNVYASYNSASGLKSQNAVAAALTFDASVDTAWYFNDVVSADNAKALSYAAAAIPEPSAFGLLAGLGALALVASRRRRSR